MTDRFLIEELRSNHDRREFKSGVDALDRYFTERVGQDVRRNVASCYVACLGETLRAVGYYTISMFRPRQREDCPDILRSPPRWLAGWQSTKVCEAKVSAARFF